MLNPKDIQNKLKLVEIEPGWYIQEVDVHPWHYQTETLVRAEWDAKLIRNVKITSNLGAALNFWQADLEQSSQLLRAEEVIPSFSDAKIVYLSLDSNDN
ncbi:hypothetical protein [uncultured Weissella sp.]|uniref:hypothetical protein n=1 Tax=uncultured Weissella sp. TaxID=253243 RepID=UPI002583F0A7|nr:hypothetical protein [uncultured Weissella sp.]